QRALPTEGEPPRPVSVGEVIGERYVVERLIAEGGMAYVVAARQRSLDEIVALKILKPEFANNPEVLNRFAIEAKAAMRIRAEHSIRVIDVGSDATYGLFLVLEYLEGADVGTILDAEG